MSQNIVPGSGDYYQQDADRVWVAFRRAVISQCHPRMIGAILLPFAIALLGAVILLWLFWTPLTGWMDHFVSESGIFNTVDGWFIAIGLFSMKLWLIPLMAAGMLLPMAGILGLVIAAIFVMPIVLRHLDKRQYKNLNRQGKNTTAIGTWNAIWVGVMFVIGWLFTLPLWLFPPMALILPVFWWAFAVNKMLRVDSIIEHASIAERKLIWERQYKRYWFMGAILSVINLIPFFWLIMPVFSSLVYAHFSLQAITDLRAENIIDLSES